MRKAQSFLEYTVLIIIIISAFLTMQVYIKRGFQGRWKQAVDDMGDQYDKNAFNSEMHYTLTSTSESRTELVPIRVGAVNGFLTFRTDNSYSIESKIGGSHIAP